MKQNILLTAIFAFILTACNSHINYNKTLVKADSLMMSHSDSALAILENYPTNDLKTQADSAYYALLLTQARDKNYIDQTDDSLIRSAIVYYDKTSDVKMQARSYYYSGSVYRDAQRSKEATTQYLKAQSLAKNANDKHLLGLIYSNLAYMYYAKDLNEQADSLYHIMEQIAVSLNDPILLTEVFSKQGMIQMEKGKEFYPKAETLLLKALHIAESITNKRFERDILSSLSMLYNKMNDGKKALKFAKQNLTMEEDTSKCYETFRLIGIAYYQITLYDSAVTYLSKALPTKDYATKAGAYMRLADIAKKQGDIATSLEMEQNYSIYMDSMRIARQSNMIIRAEKDAKIISQQEEYANFISKYHYYLLFAVIVAFIILIILKREHNKTILLKKEKELLITDQTVMQQQYIQLRTELQQKEERISYLQKEVEAQIYTEIQKQNLLNELDKLSKERNTLLKESFEKSTINIKMKRIIQSYKKIEMSEEVMEQEDWLQLIAETDLKWNNITLQLQSKYNLSQEEIHLCCLFLTDFPVSNFSYLLNCTRDAIYKKANRIIEQKMGIPQKVASLKEILMKIR